MKARKEAKLTQAALAERIGVSSEAVSKWEQNKYPPSETNLQALLDVLGIPFLPNETEDLKARFFDEQHMSAFLKGKLNVLGCMQALKAVDYAKEKHAGQFRKPGNVPYINHPLTAACHALAMGIQEDELLAAILLHDVLEDCDVKAEDLPFSSRVRALVVMVTKTRFSGDEREKLYYQAIAEDAGACLIKCIDRCNNLSSMAMGFTREKISEYVKETEEWYPRLLQTVKAEPKYNDAAWLLTYQMRALLALAKRVV